MINDIISWYLKEELTPSIEKAVEADVSSAIKDLLRDVIPSEGLRPITEKNIEKLRAEISGEPPTAPKYPDLIEFVTKFLCTMYGTAPGARPNWTADWHTHPEAVSRLAGLWERFEKLRLLEPDSYLETFLRQHGDYHMNNLMNPDGVFAACRSTNVPTMPLPTKKEGQD